MCLLRCEDLGWGGGYVSFLFLFLCVNFSQASVGEISVKGVLVMNVSAA